TENYISYKSLGFNDDQKEAAREHVESLYKDYKDVKGVKEEYSFDDTGVKESVVVDYTKADLEELSKIPGMNLSGDVGSAKKISMKTSGEWLEKNGFKEVKEGKFEELKK
ncbi:MAG: DUF1307 domain-containing protein, partial [Candidatus Saccharibacteria bacterium]|nr:DUF1307 domain-containing protein [Candidatus Saccharibacteria bacterium]